MKFVLLLVIFSTCVCIGFEIKKFFADRLKFYESMMAFCEYAKQQISFYGTTKDKILECGKSEILANVFDGIDNRLLSSAENQKVQEFINSIGRYDSQNEIQNIEFYKTYFAQQVKCCQSEMSKKGGLSLKLSILVGILLCILLL